jgi:hypothetical protein
MVIRINLLNGILKPQSRRWGSKMASLKDIITNPWTWGITLGAVTAITVGIIAFRKNQPELEQRVTEKQEFHVAFGSQEKKYSDSKETYGMGLAVLEALAKESDKKMTDSEKFYFITAYLDTNDKDGVSPQELSDYINGKKADGSARNWTKDLKPVATKEDGMSYTYQVDLNPTQMSRLNSIIEKHAAIRHARYKTQDDKEMWRYHAMKWAADNFGKDNYLNADAVNKYEAHVNKVEGALK